MYRVLIINWCGGFALMCFTSGECLFVFGDLLYGFVCG